MKTERNKTLKVVDAFISQKRFSTLSCNKSRRMMGKETYIQKNMKELQ